MPYSVKSMCGGCGQGDEFRIGVWPDHLGLYVCRICRSMVNIPLETERCPGCNMMVGQQELYDYARAIPYLRGDDPQSLAPGPLCPKCGKQALTFTTTAHLNMGRLGSSSKNPPRLWLGKDYLEKAIFVYAIFGVCGRLKLDAEEILRYYNVDVPGSMIAQRAISMPICMDIQSHLSAVAAIDQNPPFRVSAELRAHLAEQTELIRRLKGG